MGTSVFLGLVKVLLKSSPGSDSKLAAVFEGCVRLHAWGGVEGFACLVHGQSSTFFMP